MRLAPKAAFNGEFLRWKGETREGVLGSAEENYGNRGHRGGGGFTQLRNTQLGVTNSIASRRERGGDAEFMVKAFLKDSTRDNCDSLGVAYLARRHAIGEVRGWRKMPARDPARSRLFPRKWTAKEMYERSGSRVFVKEEDRLGGFLSL